MSAEEICQSLLDSATKLEFELGLSPRKPNAHPNGRISKEQEQWLRPQINDYAEFFVPIFWSGVGFLGKSVQENTTSVELAAQGISVIAAEATPGFVTRYLLKLISGTSYQSPGLRRQGYLVVCRESLVIIALNSDWTPSPVTLGGDGRLLPHLMERQIPPVNACWATVALQLRYEDFESFTTSELVRFDGLAMMLHGFDEINRYERAFEKIDNAMKTYEKEAEFSSLTWPESTINLISRLIQDVPEITERTSETGMSKTEELAEKVTEGFITKAGGKKAGKLAGKLAGKAEAFVDNSGYFRHSTSDNELWGFGDWFKSWFYYASDYVQQSLNVASGTGIDEQTFMPLRTLFNSALGIRIESAQNGQEFFVESPFSELDAAVDAIQFKLSNATKQKAVVVDQTPAKLASSSSLAEQLAQLHSLHQAGALSDEEFAAAKAALLNPA